MTVVRHQGDLLAAGHVLGRGHGVDVEFTIVARLARNELGAAVVLDITLSVDGETSGWVSTLVTLELGRGSCMSR